jgi:uracil phosphoribosyltransferase
MKGNLKMAKNQRPSGTVRLVVDINEGIMARAKTFLLQVKYSDHGMSRRTLVETALTEYLDGTRSNEREEYFQLVKIIRDNQVESQKLLRAIGQAQILFAAIFSQHYIPTPEADMAQLEEQRSHELELVIEELRRGIGSGETLTRALLSAISPDDPGHMSSELKSSWEE